MEIKIINKVLVDIPNESEEGNGEGEGEGEGEGTGTYSRMGGMTIGGGK
jgi:hypothetical protein